MTDDRNSTELPPPPRASFASDNAAGAHPKVLDALVAANDGPALAYGDDPHTAACEERFRELFGADVTTRLVFNGTGANIVALATLLGSLPGPHHAVVCTSAAHIAVDETGAPERLLGTKLIDLDAPDAKLVPEQIDDVAHALGDQHHAQPGVVSITQATELGALYTPDEIAALCDRAHAHGMLVHLDGARLANATAALGGTVDALRAMTIDAGVDAVSFGGTKNGLVGAEAVVFCAPQVATGSEYVRKQVSQLPSKMRFVAAQFNAVLDGDLWIELAAHANGMASLLYDSVVSIPGIDLDGPPAVNSIFPRLPRPAIRALRDWTFFWDWDVASNQVRWMTSWATTPEDVTSFTSGVRKLVGTCN